MAGGTWYDGPGRCHVHLGRCWERCPDPGGFGSSASVPARSTSTSGEAMGMGVLGGGARNGFQIELRLIQ